MGQNATVEKPTGLPGRVASAVHTVIGFERPGASTGIFKMAQSVTAEKLTGSSVNRNGDVPTAIDPVDQCQLESGQLPTRPNNQIG